MAGGRIGRIWLVDERGCSTIHAVAAWAPRTSRRGARPLGPHALERALTSIAADTDTLEAADRATQHLWFRNTVKPGSDRWSGWLSTHPSLGARIDRLRVLEGLEPLGATAAVTAET